VRTTRQANRNSFFKGPPLDVALYRAIGEPGLEVVTDCATNINLVFTIRYRVPQKMFLTDAARHAFRLPRTLPEDGKTMLTLGLNWRMGL
jgi:hypothetical protein